MAKKSNGQLCDVQSLVADIENSFGKEMVCDNTVKVEMIQSGSLKVDEVLGGGYPIGRVVEIAGWESSGKTTFALHLCKEVQLRGRAVGYIDTENALDMEYAKSIGVDVSPEKFVLCQPGTAEDALSLARKMLSCEAIGVVVLDSVAAMVAKCIIEGEVGEAKMAVLARLMSQQMPILNKKAAETGCILFCINQYRKDIGGFTGSGNSTAGGKALPFYCSQRLEISRVGNKTLGDDVVGIRSKVVCKKNKVAPPFKKCEIQISFGVGFDNDGELLEQLIESGIITKSGGWYKYRGTNLANGEKKLKELFESNPELLEEMREALNSL